jgi:hypothetical protein
VSKTKGILLVVSVMIQTGCCISVSNFQSPKVLKPGKKIYGIGAVTTIDNRSPFVEPVQIDVHSRLGIMNWFDVGFNVFSARGVGVGSDIKFQIIKKPVFFSFAQGFSYSYSHIRAQPNDYMSHILGIYSTFLLGNERFYMGYKTLAELNNLFMRRTSLYQFPGYFVGFSAGDKLRLNPEIGYYGTSPGRYSSFGPVVIGVGLQYGFD